MSEKFFGQSMNPKEHIKQELDDAGISHPSEWREAVHFEDEGQKAVIENTESKVEAIKTGEINNENWQRRLDTAFEQNDYELIKTLRKVRPQSAPKAELIEAKMRELITTRPNQWVETFGKIKSISSDVELDQILVAGEFGKLFEKFAQEKGITEQLKEFKRATGYAPSPEVVQAKYRSIFAGKKSYNFDTEDLIKGIKGLTGTQPDKAIFQEIVDTGDILQAKRIAQFFSVEVTSEMVQRSYEVQFEKNGYLGTHYISEIGEKPNQALVERAYQRIIEKRGERWIDSIKSLEQATGVKPVFTQEQMRPVFEEFLQRGWYGQKGYVGIDHLTEMTGMKPPVDLVEKTALKIIDGGHQYIDQGKTIKEGLKRLEESVGVSFEIPESEVQDRYQKAIDEKKAHVISNLHGALGISPSVDKETARQFMVGLMDETYHNPIPELEKVFGVKFKATDEEIEAKQNEDLEKLRFDNLAKITELTGKEYDKQKLETALAKLLEKEATIPSDKRGSYSSDWGKNVKQRLEQFGVVISPEVVTSIYKTIIQNETIYSNSLTKVCEITGVPLPADLAQLAYRNRISSNYAYSVKTGQGSYQGYGSLSGAFEELFKISGVRPEIPEDQLQNLYRSCLEGDSIFGGRVHEIQKIAEITAVKPVFNPEDINNLYKKWILGGREGNIRNVKEVTGIELQLDEETLAYISQEIESGIEKAKSGNYEQEEYGKKKFESYQLERDLNRVNPLIKATGVNPDTQKVQLAYSEILAQDPYWATKIEQIEKATNIKPAFTSEQLKAKGAQLLADGKLRALEGLLKFGEVQFSPEEIERGYRGLLDTNQSLDDDNRKYYDRDWVDRIKRLQKLSGIAPTEIHLAEIFSHILKDKNLTDRYDRIGSAVELFEKNFGAKVNETIIQDIYKELFTSGDLESISGLKKKTGLVPEIAMESVREKCDDLLQKRDFKILANIKTLLDIATLPLTSEVVQAEYIKLVDNPKFATREDKDIEVFYSLYELTRVRPELSPEQTGLGYRKVMFASYDGSYDKFERVVGIPPTESDLQNQVYIWLIQDYSTKDNILKFTEKHKIKVSPEIAQKAVARRLEKITMDGVSSFIKIIKLIEEISDTQIRLEADVVEKQVERIIQGHKPSEYSCTELDDLFQWFEENTGQKPSQKMVDLAYTQTLGQSISYAEGKDLKAWDWLKQKYGLPTPQAVQQIYLSQLASK